MKHPTQNEWLLYLDGDASPEDVDRLLEHLDQCPMCAAELAGWKRTVQRLRQLPFPEAPQARPDRRRHPLWVSAFVKWGLAAAIVLLVGFAFGRLSALRVGPLQQAVAAQVSDQLRGECREDLLTALDPSRQAADAFQQQLRQNVQAALMKAAAKNDRRYRDIMEVVQQQRQQDQERLLALIKGVREQQMSDCLALRQDLETAVSTADSDLRQDSRRINELADTLSTPLK